MYEKISRNEVPKRERKAESRFEVTPEWAALKCDIDRGRLRPTESLKVTLTNEDKERYRIKNRRSIARFIQKYIAGKELPLIVKSFRRGDLDFVVVEADTSK